MAYTIEDIAMQARLIDKQNAGKLNDIQAMYVNVCISLLQFIADSGMYEISKDEFRNECGEIFQLIKEEFARRKFGYFSPGFNWRFSIDKEQWSEAISHYLYL